MKPTAKVSYTTPENTLLSEEEAELLQQLLQRAIENNQLSLAIASEYSDGHSFSDCRWEVEVAECEGERLVDPENEAGEWEPYKQHEVTVYIGDDAAQFLAGNNSFLRKAAAK